MIHRGDLGTSGDVYKNGVAKISVYHHIRELFQVCMFSCIEEFLPAIEIDAIFGYDHAAAVGESHDTDLQTELFCEISLLLAQLVDQSAADVTGACNKQVDLLVRGFKEFFVQDVQCLAYVGGGYDGRDIAFRGSLSDGTHVDAVASEGAKHSAADARVAFHLFSDECYDRQVFFDAERFYFLKGDLYGKGFIHQLFGIITACIVDSHADAVFGRSLSDEDDVDLSLCQGFEQSFGKAGDTHHATAFEAEQCDVVDA